MRCGPGDLAITAKLTHAFNSCIDARNTQIFSCGLIGILCGQRTRRKDAGKHRNEIKSLRPDALLRLRNTDIMDMMAFVLQLSG